MRFTNGFRVFALLISILGLVQYLAVSVQAQSDQRLGKASRPAFTLEQRQAIERLSYELPVQETPAGPSGISRILFIEDEDSPVEGEGIEIRGFTFRVPKNLDGDLVLWAFHPAEPASGIRLEPKVFSPRGTTGVSRPALSLKVARTSWLRLRFPDLGEEQVQCLRIPKEDLVPGALHAMAFATHRGSEFDRIAVTFNFTDGFNEDIGTYLPIHRALPRVD